MIPPMIHATNIKPNSPVNPVRNSSRCDSKPSRALNPAGIILKSNLAAEQRGIISNGEIQKGSL